MRYVELVPGVRSSVLGFGCAPVLGAVDGRTAALALQTALDEGITHFDLARSYGYGEAERFVGRLLGSRRDEVCLVTKFGLAATPLAWCLRPLKPIVRGLKQARRGRRRAQNGGGISGKSQVSDWLHRRVPISGAAMRRSLEASLQALRTDRIDALLLHEPQYPAPAFAEAAECAAKLKQEGKIRAWGLATRFADLARWSADLPRFDLLQFDAPAADSDYRAAVQLHGGRSNVLFSPLRRVHPGGSPAPPADALRSLWRDFPRSIVLCSMFNVAHIRENVRCVEAVSQSAI